MASLNSEIVWNKNLNFTGNIRGHEFIMDASKESGGDNLGPSPKELALAGLAGCSAMDVVMILQKMRQPLDSCKVVTNTGLTEGQPSVFENLEMVFELGAKEEIKHSKIQQAVELSMSKYCGVGAMISKTTDINYRVVLNGEEILKGKANF